MIMKRVYIINEVNNMEFGAEFETQELAQAWINKQIAKQSWGKPQRQLHEEDQFCLDNPSRIIENVTIIDSPEHQVPVYEVDENGNIVYAQVGLDEQNNPIMEPVETGLFETVAEVNHVECVIKADYVITITDITEEYNLQQLRMVRDKLLIDTDKYMISDYPISNEDKADYTNYRQYLRDLPSVVPVPTEVLEFQAWKDIQ
jgi:hypothetical protein